MFKKIPDIEKINNIIWEVHVQCDPREISVNCVWHFVNGDQAPLTSSLVDELFSVHKSEKNGNPREIVGNQGQTRRDARFGTCKISRQPNPDRLDFARWNYAEMLRNHARGSSAVARYRLLFITWFTRCSFTTYSGRRNCDNCSIRALLLFNFLQFFSSFAFQTLLINFAMRDSFFFLYIYRESKKDWRGGEFCEIILNCLLRINFFNPDNI